MRWWRSSIDELDSPAGSARPQPQDSQELGSPEAAGSSTSSVGSGGSGVPGASRRQVPEYLLVGEIATPHGLRGEVSVRVLSENQSRFASGSSLRVGRDPARAGTMQVEALRVHAGRALVKFRGIEDRSSAETLRGLLVFVEFTALGRLEPHAYWEHDLVGARVMDVEGNDLGIMRGVEGRLEQDIWQVETSAGIVLVPAAKDIIASVDLDRGCIVINPPEGLFSQNASPSSKLGHEGGRP